MSVFSYHLVKLPFFSAVKVVLFPPTSKDIQGLMYAQCMFCMTLGAPVFSLSRILFRRVAVFSQWENEKTIDKFLSKNTFGKKLSQGWHTRLIFIRQWGKVSRLEITDEKRTPENPDTPVVAVTIARMKLPEIPRFIRWGRPVEKLVRDHHGTTLSLASIRFPRTVSTFSIWKSQKEMTDMVHGHSSVPQPKRHINAMKERNRKDFHFEFTTLRFQPISEFGKWNGQTNFIPNFKKN